MAEIVKTQAQIPIKVSYKFKYFYLIVNVFFKKYPHEAYFKAFFILQK
jgi:hypothetical protein